MHFWRAGAIQLCCSLFFSEVPPSNGVLAILSPLCWISLKPTVWISVLPSVSCFEGSRTTGSIFQLFRMPGAVGSSTRKTCIIIHTYTRDKRNTWGCVVECKIELTFVKLRATYHGMCSARLLQIYIYKWKNHFPEMKGDVGMSVHEKGGEQVDAWTETGIH